MLNSDVRQAYLQSAEPLKRDVLINKPIPEFELPPKQCLPLLKPLYGFRESTDLWFTTLDEHHRKDLGMTSLRSDPALYVRIDNGLLKGISGTYVDDMLRAGERYFWVLAMSTSKKFDMAEDEKRQAR